LIYAPFSYDDPRVYDLNGQGLTSSVFQLESGGMKRMLKVAAQTV
jgi:DNA polymerase III alpha subunit